MAVKGLTMWSWTKLVFRTCTELTRSCVKVEVAVLGSLSPIVLIVFVDVKQHSI